MGQKSCYKSMPTLAIYGKQRPTSAISDRGWGSAGVDGSVGVEVNQEGRSAVWDICFILKKVWKINYINCENLF